MDFDFLSQWRSGGWTSNRAPFNSELACEKAGQAVQKTFKVRYEGHVCVPTD
jgi:hypothetical protein